MGTEELLAIVGIVLAIIAIVSERNREYLFLKFSRWDVWIMVIAFLIIHYLIAFDWLQGNWWPWSKLFTHNNGVPAPALAYFFTLALLGFMSYKVFFAFFPRGNREKLIKYYKRLNQSFEHSFLLVLIEKFHKKDITEYLKKRQEINVSTTWPFDDAQEKKYEEAYNKAINTDRLQYGASVWDALINDDVFLEYSVNPNPYLFVDFIAQLDKESFSNERFVNTYLAILMKHKNYHFFREVRNTEQSGSGGKYVLEEEYTIIKALFSDMHVAEHNAVYNPVARAALKELGEEAEKSDSFFRRPYNDEEKEELWNTRTMIAIHFFDVMVREAIYQEIGWHMWLYYYRTFVDALLENIPSDNNYDPKDNEPTINHRLIDEIMYNQCKWLEVAKNLDKDNLVVDTCVCIGDCLYRVALSDKISDAVKVRAFNQALSSYFKLLYWENARLQSKHLKEIFLCPVPGFNADYGDNFAKKLRFYRVLNLAWEKFDKIEYTFQGNFESVNNFQSDVIDNYWGEE